MPRGEQGHCESCTSKGCTWQLEDGLHSFKRPCEIVIGGMIWSRPAIVLVLIWIFFPICQNGRHQNEDVNLPFCNNYLSLCHQRVNLLQLVQQRDPCFNYDIKQFDLINIGIHQQRCCKGFTDGIEVYHHRKYPL